MAMKHPEIFFDLPLSRFCGVFERPSLWPAIRLLWRYPLPVKAAGALLDALYLLLARLELRGAQAFIEPHARRFEYWRGLRLVFRSADDWRETCRKAVQLRDSVSGGKEAIEAKAQAAC